MSGRNGAHALALIVSLALPAGAQEPRPPQVDCTDGGISQADMTFCASAAYADADAELNHVYGLAMTRARVIDGQNGENGLKTPIRMQDALRQAQRDWIPFRDNACAAEAMLAQGGTIQPMLGTMCLTRLTDRRVEDLRRFGVVP